MNRVIRLRLRTAGILRDETIHQIEHDLFRDQRVAINFSKAFRTEPGTLRKPAPVVDVRDGHVVHATGDPIRFTDTHHRDIDDLVHLAGDDLRKMTHVAGSLGIGEKRHFSGVADILEIAPYEFSCQRSREDGFRVIPVVRRD